MNRQLVIITNPNSVIRTLLYHAEGVYFANYKIYYPAFYIVTYHINKQIDIFEFQIFYNVKISACFSVIMQEYLTA